MANYIFLGGGGFALELYSYMEEENMNVLGYYALEESDDLKGVLPWLGDETKIEEKDLIRDAEYIIAARLTKVRKKMIEFIEKNNLTAGTYISREAYISKTVKLGEGAVIYPRAMLTGNADIGNYIFMDALSIVSHGDVIGKNVVLGPAVTICGDCYIGDNCTFGVNSAVLPGSKIGANTEVAIGTFPGRKVSENSVIISQPGKNFGKGINKNFN